MQIVVNRVLEKEKMNKKYQMDVWRKAVKQHKRQRFLRWIWEKIGYRFIYLGWTEPQYPSCIPMKPRKNEMNKDDDEWSGYYTPKEYVENVLPMFFNMSGE